MNKIDNWYKLYFEIRIKCFIFVVIKSYSDFDIISETKIRVNYTYGGGDMDFNDSFTVEIE